EQIGDRGQPDVRVRADVGFRRQARFDQLGAHAVEEDVGPDHAPARKGQYPSDLEAAQVAGPLADEKFDHVAPPGCRRRLPWATSSQLLRTVASETNSLAGSVRQLCVLIANQEYCPHQSGEKLDSMLQGLRRRHMDAAPCRSKLAFRFFSEFFSDSRGV